MLLDDSSNGQAIEKATYLFGSCFLREHRNRRGVIFEGVRAAARSSYGTVGGAVDACHQQRDQCAGFDHLADSRASWLSAVDILMSTLKAAGIWSTFDLFYCFAASSANACAFNWVDTSVEPLTAHGALSYHSNAYTASDGSTGYS